MKTEYTPADKIVKFYEKFLTRTYQPSQILVFAGEEPDSVMLIISGQVIQYEVSPQGEKVIVNSFKPGAFFPMSWALNHTPNSYFYETSGETKLKKAPPVEVIEFLKSEPEVLLDLLSRVYRGTDGLLRRTAHLMGSTANTRILFELIILAKRFGVKSGDGAYVIQSTENEIGERTGLSRETVNRELHKLKKSGLLQVRRGELEITSLAKIEQIIGTDL